MKISKNFTSKDYLDLNLNINEENWWVKAILILKDRIETRFFRPLDLLIESEKDNKPIDNYFWFSVLALSCLLIETIQWFKKWIYNHKGKSEKLIKEFCSDIWLNEEEQNIFFQIRCSILHKWETEGILVYSHNWDEKVITKYSEDETILERNILYKKIKENFYEYLNNLKKDTDLKNNYINVMDCICNKQAKW